VGRVRAGNEDSLLVDPSLGLYVVADGLGGHRAGEVASALAVERIHERVRRGSAAGEEPAAVLARALLDAHDAVRQAADGGPELTGMGTTAVVGWISGADWLWLASVGDSRAYRLRAGVLDQLTEDDTLFEELRRAGELPADPLAWPPRQQLTQALGPSPAVVPRVSDFRLTAGDRILLCSDGLTDMLSDAEIGLLLSGELAPQQVCDALVEAANQRGGRDNITVALIEVVATVTGRTS
jgi:PPM family protein phosphatase